MSFFAKRALPALRSFPATKVLIVLNCAIYLVESLAGPGWNAATTYIFALSRQGLEQGWFWQLVTHQFLHAPIWSSPGIIHLLINMCALWFAGREVEAFLGWRKFLVLYFLGGIIGGVLQVFFMSSGFLLGASGAVSAVVLAFTTLYPNAPITALLFFILPVRIKAKYLGWGILVASLGFALLGWEDGVGHLAHLGGCLVGYAFIKISRLSSQPALASSASERDVEEILQKLMREGFGGLSVDEKRTLEKELPRRTRKNPYLSQR